MFNFEIKITAPVDATRLFLNSGQGLIQWLSFSLTKMAGNFLCKTKCIFMYLHA